MINTGNDVNVVNLIGNLVEDVSWRTDDNGNKIIGFFKLGTARKFKDKFVSDWHTIVVKGPAVAKFPEEVKKGSRVSVQGLLAYIKKDDSPVMSPEILLETIKVM